MTLDPEAGKRLKAFMEPRIGAVQPWAERHGIGRDTIYALWRGRQPSPATVSLLADALGVDYDDLLRIRAGVDLTPSSDLTQVLIEEQRETRAMLERVLSLLATPPPEDDDSPVRASEALERAATQSSPPRSGRSGNAEH